MFLPVVLVEEIINKVLILFQLTTFQNFFMRFELPNSAIRGEVIILQITVFNFLQKDLSVFILLYCSVDNIIL